MEIRGPHTLTLPIRLPSGPECERCIARLQSELGFVKGVTGAAVNNARTCIQVEYDPNLVTLSRIEMEAERIGAEIAARIDHQTFELRNLDCPDCAASIERAVNRLPGVLWASANFAAAHIHVEYERGKVTQKQIGETIEGHNVRACPLLPSDETRREPTSQPSRWQDWMGRYHRHLYTGICLLLTVVALLLSGSAYADFAPVWYAGAVAVGGAGTARAALCALRRRAMDMNVLMTMAVIGAMALGEWFEAATVVVLYNIGNLLQAGAMERTRRSIRSLMQLSPKTARVRRGRGEFDVPVEQVCPDETIIVRPGERIPMDGEILAGTSAINESPITGESLPVERVAGERVFAGTLNGTGTLEVRVTHTYRDTTLARILHRVEEAQAQRAPAQQFIDRFAAVYTPIVVALAAAIALLPPLTVLGWSLWQGAVMLPWIWQEWFHRALSLLIIACPCALIISTPVAIVTAIGSASRNGILIKGGAYLEEVGSLRALLYDKTGTLTHGRFAVEDVLPLNGESCRDMLRLAAAIEARSEHPLASAFTEAAGARDPDDLPAVTEFKAFPGQGARARVEGEVYYVGNAALLASHNIPLNGARAVLERVEALGKTAVLIANSRQPLAIVVLSDQPRSNLQETVRQLEELGIEYQAMLTGDNAHVARSVAGAAGIKHFKAQLLPDQKLNLVREYQQQYKTVGMVGDGINDAPALAASNVGIVMGAAGSDTAIETADVALMGDDLTRLPYLIRLSRRTRAIIRQNIAFSLVTKALLVLAAVFISLPLWLAVMGDVGVSLLVTLNALRLMRD
jgi:Cd2+/Zn2+-exporting ATPase